MKTEQYKNTPFTIVENEETNEVFIVVGNAAVLQCETKEAAINAIEERDYNLLCNFIFLIKNFNGNENKTKRTSKKQRSTK